MAERKIPGLIFRRKESVDRVQVLASVIDSYDNQARQDFTLATSDLINRESQRREIHLKSEREFID